MKKIAKILLALVGVVLIALGIYCIRRPMETLYSTAWLLGILTLVAGILLCIFTFRTQKFMPNSASRLLQALLLIGLGIFFLALKANVAISIPIAFSIWVLLEGVIQMINSFDYKKSGYPGWWGILLVGLAVAVIGFLGLRNPNMAGRTLTTLIGCGIIGAGACYLIALFGLARFERTANQIL